MFIRVIPHIMIDITLTYLLLTQRLYFAREFRRVSGSSEVAGVQYGPRYRQVQGWDAWIFTWSMDDVA